MLMTTQNRFEDHEIAETLGVVKGNTIRSRHIGKDITVLLRNIVGGEITEYTKMMGESREQAIDRLVAEAESLGRTFGYGTGVRLKQKKEPSET